MQLTFLWLSVFISWAPAPFLVEGTLPCGTYNGFGKGYILVASFEKGQKVVFAMTDGNHTKDASRVSYKMTTDGKITVDLPQSEKARFEEVFPGLLKEDTLTHLAYGSGQNVVVTEAEEPTGTLPLLPVSVSRYVNCTGTE